MGTNANRPSSLKRRENLRRLTDELKLRDMGTDAVMELLGCVRSTARTYLHELLAEQVIYLCNADSGRWVRTPVYRVRAVKVASSLAPGEAQLARKAGGGDRWRDPLMAALFGTPG